MLISWTRDSVNVCFTIVGSDVSYMDPLCICLSHALHDLYFCEIHGFMRLNNSFRTAVMFCVTSCFSTFTHRVRVLRLRLLILMIRSRFFLQSFNFRSARSEAIKFSTSLFQISYKKSSFPLCFHNSLCVFVFFFLYNYLYICAVAACTISYALFAFDEWWQRVTYYILYLLYLLDIYGPCPVQFIAC